MTTEIRSDEATAPSLPGLGLESHDLVTRDVPMMGGRVGVHLQPASGRPADLASVAAANEADRVLRRLAVWADRLTRFDERSELSQLNADPRAEVQVGPTMAAIMDWSRLAEAVTDGIVDIGLLDARLRAEHGPGHSYGAVADSPRDGAGSTRPSHGSRASRSWSLDRRARGAHVRRPFGLRFDLDGVAKGWLADRALDRLDGYPAAVVDADGDIAIRLDRGAAWWFGVADPRATHRDLAVLGLRPRLGHGRRDGRFGLATSGTSIHRWYGPSGRTHHLIDPRTGRPAETDVVQATVLTRTAREAEALAKAVVIMGAAAGYDLLERVGVDGALLLTENGELMVHPSTMRWLA
jgi:thiamine biosynthesis lipoprotein